MNSWFKVFRGKKKKKMILVLTQHLEQKSLDPLVFIRCVGIFYPFPFTNWGWEMCPSLTKVRAASCARSLRDCTGPCIQKDPRLVECSPVTGLKFWTAGPAFSLRSIKKRVPTWPSNPFPGYLPPKFESIYSQRHTHPCVLWASPN